MSPATTGTDGVIAQRFGKFFLVRRLAVGGMAEIFLAEHRGEAGFVLPVVIKRVLPELCENPEFVTMFLDEARLIARLTHPNVVQVHDFGRIDKNYFLALEYVRGGNLRDLLGRVPEAMLPLGHALYIISQVLAGLDHAHRARGPDGAPLKLVHRDISPSNVLISLEGAVKLADFGIARSTAQRAHTAAFVIKGKLAYMSPEQIMGRPLDARSDIFSVGVVLWELVTGQRLFARDSVIGIQLAICREPIPDASTVRPDLPAAVVELLERALRRDRELRFPTAAAMQLAIEQCLVNLRLVVGAQQLAQLMQQRFPELREDEEHAPAVALEQPSPAAPERPASSPDAVPTAMLHTPRPSPAAASATSRPSSTVLLGSRSGPAAAPAAPPHPRTPTRSGAAAALTHVLRRPAAIAARLGLSLLWLAGAAFVLGGVVAVAVYFMAVPEKTITAASSVIERAEMADARAARAPEPNAAPSVAVAPVPDGHPAVPEPYDAAPATRPDARGGATLSESRTLDEAAAAARDAGARRPKPRPRPRTRTVVHKPPPEITGLLSIQARPSAAALLDGRRLGETPIYRRRVPAGWHVLELRAPMHAPLRGRIYVPPRGEFKRTYELIPE